MSLATNQNQGANIAAYLEEDQEPLRLSDVPFENLKVGDQVQVISGKATKGKIVQLWPHNGYPRMKDNDMVIEWEPSGFRSCNYHCDCVMIEYKKNS